MTSACFPGLKSALARRLDSRSLEPPSWFDVLISDQPDHASGENDERLGQLFPDGDCDETEDTNSNRQPVADCFLPDEVCRPNQNADDGHADATNEAGETRVPVIAEQDRRGQNGEKHR